MVFRTILRKDTYYDSIVLMKTSNRVAELVGVVQAAVVMATPTNRLLLEDLGFFTPEIEKARSNDLVIALETENQENMNHAILEVDNLLSARESIEDETFLPRTLDSALRKMQDASLALISVPGAFAKREASKALRRGLNVFLFSSNVSIEEELDLKKLAKERGLLMMGPDCGTAIINNIVLGFGNNVNQGGIGLVSAAGTGLQQVTTLIDNEGLGISHAIGTGGSDLSREIGGITMIEGLRLLENDEATKAIVLISKPPSSEVSESVLNVASRSKKPIVVNFIGESIDKTRGGGLVTTATLEDAARAVCAIVKGDAYEKVVFSSTNDEIVSTMREESSGFSEKQRHIRGLFSGGTLCYEAMAILEPLVGNVLSNISSSSDHMLDDAHKAITHSCIDMGTEEFTTGRPHPMIDYTLRKRQLIREAQDPTTAVLLMDVVLGYGAHSDPAAELVPNIRKAKKNAERNGGFLSVVVSIVGTSMDHQGFQKQKQNLEEAGVVTMPSNAQAVRMAALIATRGAIERNLFE